MSKTLTLSNKILSFVLIGGIILTTALVVSGQEAVEGEDTERRHGPSQEVKDAIASGSYTDFVNALPEDAKILEVINESNFDQLVQLHALKEAGEYEEVKELAEELGLPRRGGHGKRGLSEEAKEALETGSYATFVEAVGEDAKILENITAENFDQLVALHEAKEAGNYEEAKAIAEELGLPQRGQRGGKKLNEEAQAAVEAGDYNAFVTAVGQDARILEKVTADNFDAFAAMKEAKADGDYETAREIAEKSGFKVKGPRGERGDGEDGPQRRGGNRGPAAQE